MLDQPLDLKEKLTRVLDRATHEAIALVLAQPETERLQAEPVLEWMNATQLAGIGSSLTTNEPTTAGIMKWAKRLREDLRCRMRTWVTSCDSIETRLISGHMKKLKDGECRTKSGV